MQKLSLCFLTLFLFAFVSCETSFRPHDFYPEIPPEVPTETPHEALAEFYEGLFTRFGLEKPYQIIYECLNNFSSGVFLESMFVFNQLLIDINARDAKHVHQDVVTEWILAILGHGASDCIVATQDFSDLIEALGIKRDPLINGLAQWFYFQANFRSLLDDYQPVIQDFNSGNSSAAGAAYGDILAKIVDTVKSKGFGYLAHTGVQNGFSFGLQIDLPNDTLSIWNDTTAGADLEFTYAAAKAVADGKWWQSYDNLIKFWEEKGKEILEKIPEEVWEALKASDDNKKVTERVGIDVLSKEFGEKAGAWIKRNQWKYHGFAKDLVKNFNSWDLIHVGGLQAEFVREIARNK